MDDRDQIIRRDGFVIGLAMLAVVCGMHFSPYFEPAFILVQFFGPAFFIGSPLVLFYLTSLLVATLALMIAGVPAALFERITGRETTDTTSYAVWLGCLFLIALPALLGAAGAG